MTENTEYDAHYLEIGKMIAHFQSLEATLKHGLIRLINNKFDSPGGILTNMTISELSFGGMTRLASAIPLIFTEHNITVKDDLSKSRMIEALAEAQEKLIEGVKLAGEAEVRRNQLVHSFWFIGPGGPVLSQGNMMRYKAKKPSGKQTTKVTAFVTESITNLQIDIQRIEKSQKLISQAINEYFFTLQHFGNAN